MRSGLTRREVVVAGGVAAAGAAAAGLVGQADAALADAAARAHDLRVLEVLLRTEHTLQYAYGRVLGHWSFNSSTRRVLDLAQRHEADHAAVLERHIAALSSGLSPAAQAKARPKGSDSPPDAVVSLFHDAQTPRDAVRGLSKVEALAEASYFNAVGELQSAELSLIASQILASEAQHWSLLLNVLTDGAMPQMVPLPFVRGVAEIAG
jgi:hypothetical protein